MCWKSTSAAAYITFDLLVKGYIGNSPPPQKNLCEPWISWNSTVVLESLTCKVSLCLSSSLLRYVTISSSVSKESSIWPAGDDSFRCSLSEALVDCSNDEDWESIVGGRETRFLLCSGESDEVGAEVGSLSAGYIGRLVSAEPFLFDGWTILW